MKLKQKVLAHILGSLKKIELYRVRTLVGNVTRSMKLEDEEEEEGKNENIF